MNVRFARGLAAVAVALVCSRWAWAGSDAADRKAEYVDAVTRGAGFMPWQERGVSEDERAFRESIERRKDEILAGRIEVRGPVLLTEADIEQARRNIEGADWARQWYRQHKGVADYVVAQPADYSERMIPELTPTHTYGFTCPNCMGRQSQEGVGSSLIDWDYHEPDVLSCRRCGHVYPSEKYPETAKLVCPRSGQTFTYYLNDDEREHPDDRSGKHAYRWVGRPMHVSFTGVIRHSRIHFMIGAARSLALVYRMTGEQRYAKPTIDILARLAHCYRNWLYHDYWDGIADCDPIYAAWHDKALRLGWKRHLCGDAYSKDTAERAAMMQSYWGAGRIHPSTGGISTLALIAGAYDLVRDARDTDGRPVWSKEDRAKVERDLLLEFVMEAEPFVGGANEATNVNNKAPRVYRAQAAVAKCLGLPQLADTALRGYEAVRDRSFNYDGYSKESPSYNNMYLSQLVQIPEELHGFRWPAGFAGRQGMVDCYRTDDRLRLMFRAMIDQLRPDGRLPPLSDSLTDRAPSPHLIELGLKRYPEYYEGTLPAIYRGGQPSEYAVFHLDADRIERDEGLQLPEICFPEWKTAILRHGQGADASMLTLAFSPPGGHRHGDNLAMFYVDRGRTVLGDHGYVGDMPVNGWIHSTLSHNLVVVDGEEQRRQRRPRLRRFVASPKVSVVEASSDAYGQCGEHRRLVALIKGPGAQTFGVDIFRVKGGKRHAYRVFSELASSDAADGMLEFSGLTMPAEPPLPNVGASLAREDIFGLRDVRGVDDPPAGWQAMWKEGAGTYRLWMLSASDRVEASNGPGQETRDQAGRRVRYVDVVREGEGIESVFVGLHEPSGPDGVMPIRSAERLPVPKSAGPNAVAVRIESAWGTYLVLSEFASEAEVAGARFVGPFGFGITCRKPDGKRWLLASEASTLMAGDFGFENVAPVWSGEVVERTEHGLIVDTPRPADWPPVSPYVTQYVLVGDEEPDTGFPVRAMEDLQIEVDRFPLPSCERFQLASTMLLSRD